MLNFPGLPLATCTCSRQHAQQLLRLPPGLPALPIDAHSRFDAIMMTKSCFRNRNITFLEVRPLSQCEPELNNIWELANSVCELERYVESVQVQTYIQVTWAAQYDAWLLIKWTPKGVIFPFFLSFLL
jgi:hypothetical protein